jgi:hypothetical protein
MPEPDSFLGDEHVRVVEAGGRAVHPPQLLNRLERVRRRFSDGAADQRRRKPPQIVFGDSMGLWQERRIADGLGAKRVELRGKVSIPPDAFGEVGRTDDLLHADRGRLRGEAGRVGLGGGPRLEDLSRGRIDRVGILPVALVELEHVPGIYSRELLQVHDRSILPYRMKRTGDPE